MIVVFYILSLGLEVRSWNPTEAHQDMKKQFKPATKVEQSRQNPNSTDIHALFSKPAEAKTDIQNEGLVYQTIELFERPPEERKDIQSNNLDYYTTELNENLYDVRNDIRTGGLGNEDELNQEKEWVNALKQSSIGQKDLNDAEQWMDNFPDYSKTCAFKVFSPLNETGCVYSNNGSYICNSTDTTEFPTLVPEGVRLVIVSNTNIRQVPQLVLQGSNAEGFFLESNQGITDIDKLAFAGLPTTLRCLYIKDNWNINGWKFDRNLLSSFRTSSELVHLVLSGNNITSLGNFEESLMLPNLEYLSLAFNKIVSIEEKSFSGLQESPIRYLNLQNCHIQYVAYGAFDYFPHVEHLNLHSNPHLFKTNFSVFFCIASSFPSTLQSLGLSSNSIVRIPTESLELVKDSLISLSLAENFFPEFGTMDTGTFPLMRNLTELILDNCGIKTIADDSFINLVSLKSLSFLGNQLIAFYPALLIPSLHTLTIQGGEFFFQIPPNLFLTKNMSNLSELRILGAKINNLTKAHLDGLDNLETLSFAGSTIQLIEKYVFNGLKRLKNLQLAFCKSSYPVSWATLRGPRNLLFLDLTCSSFNIQPNTLRSAPRRIEVLNLTGILSDVERPLDLYFISEFPNLTILEIGHNNIRWNVTIFGASSKIESIKMTRNSVNLCLTDAMISDFFNSSHLQWLDLSENVFQCNDIIYKFYKYAHQNPGIEIKNYDNGTGYMCSDPITHEVKSFKNFSTFGNEISDGWTNIEAGEEENTILQVSISALVVFVVTVSVSTLLYRNRWYIRYYYECYLQRKRGVERQEPFLYDAFISYSKDDEDWVCDKGRHQLKKNKFQSRYPPFHKTLLRSSALVKWILVRFNETDCI